MATALTVIYTFLLLGLFLYIFACLAVELMAKDRVARDADPEYDALIAEWFPDMFTTMVSLTQFVTCDSVSSIYRVIVLKQPWLLAYFVLMVLLMTISLMNLVTALIVEGARDQSATEKTIEKQMRLKYFESQIPRLMEIFNTVDTSGDGCLSIDEILRVSGEDAEFLLNLIPAEDMAELFEILDTDEDGEIPYEEFIESLRYIMSADLPLPTIRILKLTSRTRSDVIAIKQQIDLIHRAMSVSVIM